MVSVVGDDFPQEYLNLLSERNIDVSGIEIVKGGKTFFWSGKYHNDLNSRDTARRLTDCAMVVRFDPPNQDWCQAPSVGPGFLSI